MKGQITYKKTERVEITLSEADIRDAIMASLANRLYIPSSATWEWDAVDTGYHEAIMNSVKITWEEPAETVTEEVK